MLTPDEWQTIRHALSVARERYVECEKTMRETTPQERAGNQRVAEAFARQTAEIDALLPKLDDL